jgi:hypothetical protein
LLVGLTGGALSVVAWIRRQVQGRQARKEQLEACQAWLRGTVRDQWSAEAERRGYWQVQPIEVSWHQTGREITAGSPTVALPETGTLYHLAEGLRDGAISRVAVIGEAGAGKTTFCVRLLLELLDNDPEPPVPVLLPAAAWNPARDSFFAFVTRNLEQAYPALSSWRFGPSAAMRLVRQEYQRRWLIPIIDGLDELDPDTRPLALVKLRDIRTGFVITSRADEYEELVLREDRVLNSEAVLELDPVDGNAAANYLAEGRPLGAKRWKELEQRLRDSKSPVAAALSTPLILSLVRTIYDRGRGRPAELTEIQRFPSRELVEAHILDEYLSGIYMTSPAPLPVAGDRARHYLEFVACHLDRLGTPNLAWWQMSLAISGLSRRLLRALIVSLAAVLLIGIATTAWISTGLIAISIFSSVLFAAYVRKHWGGVYLIAAVNAATFWFAAELSGNSKAGIIGSLGIAIGILVASRAGAPGSQRTPRQLHLRAIETRRDFLFAAQAALGAGLVGAASAGMTGNSLVAALVAGFAAAMTTLGAVVLVYSGRTRPEGSVSGPLESLREDARWTAIFSIAFGAIIGIGLAVAIGLTALGADRPFRYWLGVAVAVGGVAAVAVGATVTASAAYFWTVWILRMKKCVPFFFMTFLSDALERGVLRQVGNVYQFRHRRLADRLVSTATGSGVSHKVIQ